MGGCGRASCYSLRCADRTMARIATTMRPTTQIASMITAAGSIGPETAVVERIKVTLQRPKATMIVTAKAMANLARVPSPNFFATAET
jgi:hypothetical protein